MMRRNCIRLSLCSFGWALGLFVFSYFLYHYTLPTGGFTTTWQPEPGKPWITFLFAVWGVTFLFAGVMSLLVGWIFFEKE